MSRDDLAALQQRLGDALTAADPAAACRGAFGDEVDADGVRVAALLIAKLRFERLVSASTGARERFVADPEAFTALFRAYHQQVPSPSLDPWGEARCFARWLDSRAAVDDDPAS